VRLALNSIAALVCLAAFSASPVLGQNKGVSSAHASNGAAGLNYNNPYNQFGMYNNAAGMTFSNPYTQPGMYNN